MDKNRFYFVNFLDGLLRLVIMILPFLYSNFGRMTVNNYLEMRVPIIFAIISSAYNFGKIYVDSKYADCRFVRIPSIIALLLLAVSLTLIIISYSSSVNQVPPTLKSLPYDVVALVLYFLHLGMLFFELCRVTINDLTSPTYRLPSEAPLKVASKV